MSEKVKRILADNYVRPDEAQKITENRKGHSCSIITLLYVKALNTK